MRETPFPPLMNSRAAAPLEKAEKADEKVSLAGWEEQEESVRFLARLKERFPHHEPSLEWKLITARYPLRTTAYYLSLIQRPDERDPVFRQLWPSPAELDPRGEEDPAGEAAFEVLPGVFHRFPDRLLVVPTLSCFVRCRYCLRKRLWLREEEGGERKRLFPALLEYLYNHKEVEEVIFSGGDPLTLSDPVLAELLAAVSALPSVRRLRLHTRALAVAPARITPRLATILQNCGVTRLVTQFNHPAELTPAAGQAVQLLRNAGVQVENQAVLLQGVNDSAEILAALFRGLAALGVRPYYLHHPDAVKGAMHFWLPLAVGRRIFEETKKWVPGVEMPAYVVDKGGAEGKVRVEECT